LSSPLIDAAAAAGKKMSENRRTQQDHQRPLGLAGRRLLACSPAYLCRAWDVHPRRPPLLCRKPQ